MFDKFLGAVESSSMTQRSSNTLHRGFVFGKLYSRSFTL